MSAPNIVFAPQIAAELASTIVDGIWDVFPGYSAEHMAREDLERFARPHVELILRVLEEQRHPSTEELQHAVELGVSRALQGVPLDSIVQAFRVAERAIVDVLLAETGPTRARPQVWFLGQVVDDLCEAALAAYRRAREEITVHYDRLESDLIAQLSRTDRVTPDVASRARLVGADPDAPHLAVAAVSTDDQHPSVTLQIRRRLLAHIGDRSSGRILSGTKGVHALLIVPCQRGSARILSALGNAVRRESILDGTILGTGEATPSLAVVGRSCRQALMATDVGRVLGRRGEVVPYDDIILESLCLTDRAAGNRLMERALGDIRDDARLLETLRAYLGSDLSHKRTASALGVHPNTVAYRLRRIQDLTGRSLRRATDLCDLAVALRAYDVIAGGLSPAVSDVNDQPLV